MRDDTGAEERFRKFKALSESPRATDKQMAEIMALYEVERAARERTATV